MKRESVRQMAKRELNLMPYKLQKVQLLTFFFPTHQLHFGDVNWTFQQDTPPAHEAKTTQYWCRTHFPDFIASSEWLPYSPDLNPMDYSVWSILEARACATRHISLESLKQSLRREWDRLSPEDLRPIAENFKTRLGLCIAAGGGHFETR